MRVFYIFSTIILSLVRLYSVAPTISVVNNRNMIIVSVDNQLHIDYGLSYPITYEFDIPEELGNLKAYKKFKYEQNWELMDEKTNLDFFNGVEVVRFAYDENIAYLSIGFSDISDSIFIKITDSENNQLNTTYMGISEYYDNRKAVVTITGDDWADYCNEKFIQACQNFRSYNLWYSVGVVTSWCNLDTWNNIQDQVDEGLVEVLSHSRTHPYVPYNDLEGEVLGSKQDIIDNLDLSGLNSYGDNEYVYAWIAPFGDYDESIDTLTSVGKYLISRLFYWYDNDFSAWNNELFKFNPTGGSIEVGSSYYWGSTDINELNNTFDEVIESDGIYHLMTHPNILQWDQDFTWDHIAYISNKLNIWYVGFGHLYLYRALTLYQESNLNHIMEDKMFSKSFKIIQNYPNPFNPVTRIMYELYDDSNVKITIYDMMGKVVNNLVNRYQSAGSKSIQWDSRDNQGQLVSAGMYFYSIDVGEIRETKKMILLK